MRVLIRDDLNIYEQYGACTLNYGMGQLRGKIFYALPTKIEYSVPVFLEVGEQFRRTIRHWANKTAYGFALYRDAECKTPVWIRYTDAKVSVEMVKQVLDIATHDIYALVDEEVAKNERDY